MYDAMVYRKLPHGLEVIFINVVNDKEEIFEDFFTHHNVDLIAMTYIKKDCKKDVN